MCVPVVLADDFRNYTRFLAVNARNVIRKITPFFQMTIHGPYSGFLIILHWNATEAKN